MKSQPALPAEFGPFTLLRRIAVGGSAEVFLGKPKDGSEPAPRLVIKRLVARDESGVDLLKREARLHRSVKHENVVRVFDAGIVEDESYLAMEYVEGVDLYRLIRAARAEQLNLSQELAAYIVRAVALALDAVHNANDENESPLYIVHRDVTPSNIYLSVQGDVKLGDFGIARMREHLQTPSQRGGIKGKFAYLSPEQIAGEPVDHRSDIFSLAAILAELLIGERLFAGSGQLAVLLSIRDCNIDPLRQRAGELTPELYEVCTKALVREPDQRFVGAREMAEALKPFLRSSEKSLRKELATKVQFAQDSKRLARSLQQKIHDSVKAMQAVKIRCEEGSKTLDDTVPPKGDVWCQLIRKKSGVHERVTFERLVEMIANAEVTGNDLVSLMGSEPRPIRAIAHLAKHLLPTTSMTTGHLFEPGIPDYQIQLEITSMFEVLAWLRSRKENGALFVETNTNNANKRRKELYLRDGRLHHVASTEHAERLGEYLIRQGALTRKLLDHALGVVKRSGGRLGDTLVALNFVDAVQVFRGIRNQGRDRVAALCGWPDGNVAFYRSDLVIDVEFPLDLDLASTMMAGAIVTSQGKPRFLLPSDSTPVKLGQRATALEDDTEFGSAPAALKVIPQLVVEPSSVGEVLEQIQGLRPGPQARVVDLTEASAALFTAKHLGWVSFHNSVRDQQR